MLVEANLMENNWGGFSQDGYGHSAHPQEPAHQGRLALRLSAVSGDRCHDPLCTHLACRGWNPDGNRQWTPQHGDPALAGTRWSIHDVVIDDLSKKYVGHGTVFEIMNAWPKNALNTVTINHVTAFPDPAGT